MGIYDRWHKSHPQEGEAKCTTCRPKRVPTREHGCTKRWQVRWRDADGDQRKRNFAKREGENPHTSAEAFDAERTADSNRGDWIDPRGGRTPFREYAPVWLDSRLHKPTTREDYEGRLNKHIYPAFGALPLGRIRQTTVQSWVKSLTAAGLAPRTVETVYVVFASIIRGAVRDGLIRRSPCMDIRLPDVKPTTIQLLTPEQIAALTSCMPARYAPLVLLGAGAGLRQGEAFGLCLDRVRFLERMITVDQQVVIVNRHPTLATPKSPASVREVPLPSFLGEALSRHVASYELDEGALFLTPRRNLLRRDYFNARIWAPAVKAAELPDDTTFHDLRHTFASTALARGVPISEVQRWLGHESITTTVDLYGHLVPDAGDRAREAMETALGEALRATHVPQKCPETAP